MKRHYINIRVPMDYVLEAERLVRSRPDNDPFTIPLKLNLSRNMIGEWALYALLDSLGGRLCSFCDLAGHYVDDCPETPF